MHLVLFLWVLRGADWLCGPQVRADEYGHSHVNHTFSVLKPSDDNPFEKGAHQVP